jgi:deoxyribodipyrimidine photo-lyase
MKNLVWFRNDLRVHDNPALSAACSGDNEVVAVYIVSEAQWEEHNDSVNKIAFWFRCLEELEKELNKLNIPLIVLKSDFYKDHAKKLLEFSSANDLENIFFNIEYPADEIERDEKVRNLFESSKKGVFSFHDQVIHNPGTLKTKAGGDFSVYSTFKSLWFAELDY